MSKQAAKFWAIMPAAGIGSRMQQNQPKQYTVLAGKTIIEHSINALLACDVMTKVMVCVSSNDAAWAELGIANHPLIAHTVGGVTRAHSVFNGLKALHNLANDSDWVLVHDAARPCLKTDTLRRFITELDDDEVGGILASKVSDTLKQANHMSQTVITRTLDRSNIWQAQTPQMFRFGLLKKALLSALDSSAIITDEASAMEQAGHQVRLIEGDADNLKVTTKSDLALAELVLSR